MNTDKTICIPNTEKEINKLSLALNEELKSKNWLLSNVQNTWWNELQWRKYPVKSRVCDAHLCEIWYILILFYFAFTMYSNIFHLQFVMLNRHKAIEGDFYSIGTISEYSVCRELLWMFHAPMHMVVFQKSGEANFSIHSNISIPSLTTVSI